MNRISPYKMWAYERDLIEYCGTVVVDDTQEMPITVFASPGVQVFRNASGNYTIALTDKLPIFAQVADADAVPADLSCIDKGFASSCMIFVSARPTGFTAPNPIFVAASQVNIVDRAQISFNVSTFAFVSDETDIGFSFRIWVTGQPAKFVPGLGA